MKKLRLDAGVAGVSEDHDVWAIPDDPDELEPPEKLGRGAYGAQRRRRRTEAETEEAEVGGLRRKLAESVPWGVEEVQANGILKGGDAADITICVVDTGYELGHPDLPGVPHVAGTDSPGNGPWASDQQGHGTHVAGTVAAVGGNGVGVAGVVRDVASGGDDDVKLHIAKGLSDSGYGSSVGVMAAVEACVDAGAKVVSMSLGCSSCSTAEENGFYRDVYEMDDVLVVAAAGNDGNSAMGYPASYSSVMSVAAVDSGLNVAYFSQKNDQVEIAGPGVGVYSTEKNGGWGYKSGTSMAAPHVSAVAALVWSHNSACSARQIRRILDASARKVDGGALCDQRRGHGLVQAQAAIDLLTSGGCDAGDESLLDRFGGYAGCDPAWIPTCDAADEVVLRLTLVTDLYPGETSWRVVASNGAVVDEGPTGGSSYGASGTYSFDMDVCVGQSYTFELADTYGDGICCTYGRGSFVLAVDGVQIASGGAFAHLLTHPFVAERSPGGGGPPPPTPGPVPTEPPTAVPTKAPTTESPTGVPTTTTTTTTTATATATPPPPPPSGCAPGEMAVSVHITTDRWPHETSWEIAGDDAATVASGGPYVERSTTYRTELCLDVGLYEFAIEDSYGDGIANGGGYVIYVDGEVATSGSDFGHGHKEIIGRCPVGTGGWRLALRTDWWGAETTWALADSAGNPLRSGGPYGNNDEYWDMACLPDNGCYQFEIFDAFGDGICCLHGSGYYRAYFDDRLVLSGGTFGGQEQGSFCGGGASAAQDGGFGMDADGSNPKGLAPKGKRTADEKGEKAAAAEKAAEYSKAERQKERGFEKNMQDLGKGRGAEESGKDAEGKKRKHRTPEATDKKI